MTDDHGVEYVYDDSGADALKWVSIGFGIGLVVGGIVGLLMAPKSGTETREQLKDYAVDLSGKTKDLATNLSEKGKEAATRAAEKGREYAHDAREKASEVGGAVRDAVSAGKEVVTRIASSLHTSGNGKGDLSVEADQA